MHLVIKKLAILSCIALICSCSSLKFPGVYRVVVQQGNFIEEDMVNQLETGMNREQVRYIMGTPMIEDTFDHDRWDYYFSVKRGDKILKKYHFQVFFKDNLLAKWQGDYRKKDQEMDSTTGSSDAKPEKESQEKENKQTPVDITEE